MTFKATLEFARHLDEHDELAHFRDRFVIDDPQQIYLDGNSLGRLPRQTVTIMQDLIEQHWGGRLIRGWNDDWMAMQERIGSKIAGLIGADANEVIIADSTSVNLFKLSLAALRFNNGRHKIITDNLNFPSDLYILQGLTQLVPRPLDIIVVPSEDGIHGPVAKIIDEIDRDTALVALSHTVFKSAYTYDMAAVSKAAHEKGAIILWDMSHSAGSVPANLHLADADLAVGCTYKYLNGGPGSPAFIFIRRDWQKKLGNPLTGWMGHSHIFDFSLDYERDPGLRHFLTGTPPILSTAAIEPGVDILLEATMVAVRAKSVKQTEFLVYLWQEWLEPLGFRLNSPRNAGCRGSHVSLGHEHGWGIDQALIHEMHVIPDFRQPDNIRLGIAPLYTSFADIYEAMDRLRRLTVEGLYEKYAGVETAVT